MVIEIRIDTKQIMDDAWKFLSSSAKLIEEKVSQAKNAAFAAYKSLDMKEASSLANKKIALLTDFMKDKISTVLEIVKGLSADDCALIMADIVFWVGVAGMAAIALSLSKSAIIAGIIVGIAFVVFPFCAYMDFQYG